jgi:predicted DNA-binding protein (MmcQ/YjbR family)
VAAFKVAGKMFALVTLGPAPRSVSLKCDPDLAPGLRRRYPAITAGYHLNKRHWNTVTLDGSVPEDELLDLIDHSYELAEARLPRAERDQLNAAGPVMICGCRHNRGPAGIIHQA